MGSRNFKKDMQKKEEEFDQRIIDVARVTRVMAGGKRMKFRVTLGIGDKKGRVGIGVAKGSDVTLGITKALAQAKKNVIKVPFENETILHPIEVKFKAAKVLIKPAKKGTGIKAGGPVRILCELAGVQNITAKILGSNNKINIVKATILAFSSFKVVKKETNDKKDSEKKTNEKEQKSPESNKEEKKGIKDKIKDIIKKDNK
jgi:small subunit ribosomal protein S5